MQILSRCNKRTQYINFVSLIFHRYVIKRDDCHQVVSGSLKSERARVFYVFLR